MSRGGGDGPRVVAKPVERRLAARGELGFQPLLDRLRADALSRASLRLVRLQVLQNRVGVRRDAEPVEERVVRREGFRRGEEVDRSSRRSAFYRNAPARAREKESGHSPLFRYKFQTHSEAVAALRGTLRSATISPMSRHLSFPAPSWCRPHTSPSTRSPCGSEAERWLPASPPFWNRPEFKAWPFEKGTTP